MTTNQHARREWQRRAGARLTPSPKIRTTLQATLLTAALILAPKTVQPAPADGSDALPAGATVFVSVAHEGYEDGSESSPFNTIQEAIDAAIDGDTVLVAPGLYVENINFLGKAITVMGEAGPAGTIIDGDRSAPVVTFDSGEFRDSVLQGFTVRNGLASDGGGILILSASPTITGNVIVDNQACFDGGGIHVNFGSALISRNFIGRNLVEEDPCGSGVQAGGGISLQGAGNTQVIRNRIIGNVAMSEGGAISMFAAGDPVIANNTIARNEAANGGAISMVNQSDALIVQNLIVDNHATEQGGALWWLVPSGDRGPLVVGNTIAANTGLVGSAVFADGFDVDTELINNIIAGRGPATTVFCGNFNDINPPRFHSNDVFSALGLAYGGICSDQTGLDGNISEDPLFVDPAAVDFRVQAGSPVIDAGNDAFALPFDLDRVMRPLDGDGDQVATVDMGAYEFIPAP